MPLLQDIARAQLGRGNHGHALGHGFKQNQALSFGARCEDKNVCAAVAAVQLCGAVQVAYEHDVGAQPERLHLAHQAFACRPFAGDDEQDIGNILAHTVNNSQQKIDVLFVRNTTYKKHHGAVLRDAVFLPERGPISGYKAFWCNAGRNDFSGRCDAVFLEHLQHGARGHNHPVQAVALMPREPFCSKTQQRSGYQWNVVKEVFFKKCVVRLHARNTQQSRQIGAQVMRHKRCLDMDDVVFFFAKQINMTHDPAVAHETVFRVQGDAPGGHPPYTGLVYA